MNRNIKIVFWVITIILVGIVIYLSMDLIKEPIKQQNKIENNIFNEIKQNNVIENNILKNELIEENNIHSINEALNNTIINTNSEVVTNTQSKEEIALQLVKDNWGNDDKVYFSSDGIDYNGKYIISVREKTTTKVLAWYEVDAETKTFAVR